MSDCSLKPVWEVKLEVRYAGIDIGQEMPLSHVASASHHTAISIIACCLPVCAGLKKLSVGVVGCGRNSDNHLRVYAHTKGVRLASVCDKDHGKAKQKARIFGAEQTFTDYETMLKIDLDLVDIVTPSPTHAPLSIRALESGHNVLVEKPMALSSTECEAMIAAARNNGRTLCVVHNKRFFQSIMQTKSILQRNELRVSHVRFTHFFALPYPGFGEKSILREEFGGVLWDSLVHHIYLTEFFIGQAQSIYASANRIKHPIDDSVTLILNGDGKAGVAEFEWDVKEPLQVFELVTAQGDRFEANLPHDLLLRRSRSYKGLRYTAIRSLTDNIHDPAVNWGKHLLNMMKLKPFEKALPFERTFFTLIGQYLFFLMGDSSSPPVSAEEGYRTIRVLEAARKSIETGKAEAP